jgi:hypothetical protein
MAASETAGYFGAAASYLSAVEDLLDSYTKELR